MIILFLKINLKNFLTFYENKVNFESNLTFIKAMLSFHFFLRMRFKTLLMNEPYKFLNIVQRARVGKLISRLEKISVFLGRAN